MNIINPNVNPEELRMDQTRHAKIWDALNERRAMIAKTVMMLDSLQERFKQMKLDGPADSFERISEYVADRNAAYLAMQECIDFISKWEQSYFTWMASEHGEETVNNKLAKAMKGLDNE